MLHCDGEDGWTEVVSENERIEGKRLFIEMLLTAFINSWTIIKVFIGARSSVN